MSTFTFETARLILNEPGGAGRLGELAAGLGMTRAMIVTDKGILNAGLLNQSLSSLSEKGVAAVVHDAVQADPKETAVLDALREATQAGIDGVIGFGGGSSMDTAKLVALLAKSTQELPAIYGIGLAKGPRFPLILVPTTAGTGSEVTPIAICTTPTDEKKGVVASPLLPDIALLDADLTLGLPPRVTAMTGIDAMVHAIESFISKHKKNPMSDALALKALALLAGNIREAVRNGGNREARAEMLTGACLAGIAFTNAPVAAVHALAYPIGGIFHVAHGLSNSLVLPHVIRFNASVAASLYAEMARAILPRRHLGDDAAATEAFLAEIEAIIADVGIERRLRDVGIGEADLPRMAKDAMNVQRLLVNNPREVTYDDALAIYQQAW